jgi:hypothetical protein
MSPPSRRQVLSQDGEAALGDRMRERLGGLFARAATRTGEGAERLREAARELRRPHLLQQALAAQERGNLEAAYWLLDEEFGVHPDHADVAVAFWNVATSLERAPSATTAAVWLVEHHSAAGETELAAQFFAELCRAVPDALVTPPAVVRMLPALRQRVAQADAAERPAATALLRLALRQAVDPRNPAPSPGLAFRIFKEAREVEPDAARSAAQLALASRDLHEAKRELLRHWLDGPNGAPEAKAAVLAPEERGPAAPVERDPTPPEECGPTPPEERGTAAPEECGPAAPVERDPAPPEEEPPLDPLSEEQVAQAAERLPPPGPPTPPEELEALGERDLLAAVPVAFGEEALELRLPGGRESRVGWREIQALAVADVGGLAPRPVTVIDCVLNWRRREREPLRVVRLRLDAFEPKCLVDDTGEDPLETFLAELLERSQAVPLPDPESALGLRRSHFESLGSYEREVLGAA